MRLHEATAAWDLSDVQVMPGGRVALVCFATARGRAAVVKLSPRLPGCEELDAEGDALVFWRSTGSAVELHDRRDGGYTLQLERLRPGTRLEDAGLGTEAMLRACGDVARHLHCVAAAPRSFQHLADGGSARTWLSMLGGEPDLQAELRGLLGEREDDVLIHGDLHGRNILRHGDGWRIVDPQPVRADRHAEIQPLFEAALSFGHDRAEDRELAERWLHTYATAAGMHAPRARRFTMLRALIGARRVACLPNPDAPQRRLGAGMQRLAEALL